MRYLGFEVPDGMKRHEIAEFLAERIHCERHAEYNKFCDACRADLAARPPQDAAEQKRLRELK